MAAHDGRADGLGSDQVVAAGPGELGLDACAPKKPQIYRSCKHSTHRDGEELYNLFSKQESAQIIPKAYRFLPFPKIVLLLEKNSKKKTTSNFSYERLSHEFILKNLFCRTNAITPFVDCLGGT